MSSLLLENEDIAAELTDKAVQEEWLGYPAATKAKVDELEKCIQKKLPTSYRGFLMVSNGWRRTSFFLGKLLSTRQVDYFRVRNNDWIEPYRCAPEEDLSAEEHLAYGEEQDCASFRAAYLEQAIQISDEHDGAVVLLNPDVSTTTGEWEAWFLASWLPGAQRHPSFWDLMQTELQKMHSLENNDCSFDD